MSDNEQILKDLKQSVETWDQSLMESSVKQALNAKIPFDVIISEGLGKGMETINDMFNEAKIFLPQIMAASKTMQSALMMIEPTLVDDKDIYRGTIIMGSVQGDIHEIGKTVCCAMLRGAGYKVYDLGSDVPPDLFVEEAQKNDADIIGGSALMTTTLVMQKNIVRSVKEQNCTAMMIFGGAPCSQEWVDSIGGDGYSASGSEIVALVRSLMKEDTDTE